MYTILAATCQHPIRQSNHLPWSGSTLDFSTLYCPSCFASRSISHEHASAERDYHRHRERVRGRRDDESREARRRFDESRVALQEDLEHREARDDRERRSRGLPTLREESRRFVGLDDPHYLAFHESMHGSSRRARVEDSASQRRESQYRGPDEYRREARQYEPGMYADRSGQGYENTSDPYASPDAARGGDLNRLSDRDLDARMEMLRANLARFGGRG